MGFCLFEHAQTPGIYFAVNVAHVSEIKEQQEGDRTLCLFVFEHRLKNFEPVVEAVRGDVEHILKEAAKIGVNKAELQVLGGRNTLRPTPLLFQHAPDVMLVRELMADEFPNNDGSFVTVSELLMDDGKTRLIVERPGVFARRVNRGNKLPILQA